MDNRGIATILADIAVFSELAGENPFKARAFQSVARSVEKHPESVAALCAEGRLREIKGIGKGIEEVIQQAVATGTRRPSRGAEIALPPRHHRASFPFRHGPEKGEGGVREAGHRKHR